VKLLRILLQPLAIAVVLAATVRSFVHIYAIPSSSMSPTLEVGDHIVVTPYAHNAQPARGDIVVFRSPLSRDIVVKRVIATPGDLIESHDGSVTIGGHPLREPYVRQPAANRDIAPQIIPAGSYFVMGDNRADSFDSRDWGVLRRELIIGRAHFVH
jgi:signal peptidase I